MPLPLGSVLGVTLQVAAFAGSEQLNATLDEKLFKAAIDIAFVKFAVVPAGTVKLVVPLEATEKSGGPVTMKLNGADVPPGAGSMTYTEYVPAGNDKNAENWVGLASKSAVTAAPLLKYNVSPCRNPVPVTVNDVGEYCWIEEGLIDEIVGTGLGAEIANGSALDGPPPGDGLATATCTVPAVPNAAGGTAARTTVC